MDDEKRVFRALYDFETEERVELPVSTGDVLLASASVDLGSDWLLVEKFNDPSARGYVPTSYVTQLTGAAAAPYLRGSESAAARASSTSLSRSALGATAAATAGLPDSPGAAYRASSMSSFTGAGAATPGVNRSSVMMSSARGTGNESFAEMFARHEQYFKQVMKQREDTFKKLEGSIASAAKEISLCQDKNAKLNQRISDLDALIDDERRKWKERLESEKKATMLKSFST